MSSPKDNIHRTFSLPRGLWKKVITKLEEQHSSDLPLGALSGLVIELLEEWEKGSPHLENCNANK